MNKSAIVCLAKDEDHYIDEWIDYHLLLGIDDIFIFRDDWNFMSDMMKYDRVHVFDVNNPNKKYTEDNQDLAYNVALDKFKTKFDFIFIIDVDEFINLKQHNTIKDLLETVEDVHSFALRWHNFGDSGLTKVEDGNYSCINRFVNKTKAWTMKSAYNTRKIVQDYGESFSFLNPYKVDIHNPNLWTLPKDFRYCFPDKSVFITDDDKKWNLFDWKEIHASLDKSDEIAYLNHYMCKTLEEYRKKYIRNVNGEWESNHQKEYDTPEKSFAFKASWSNEIFDDSLKRRYAELKGICSDNKGNETA